MAFQPATDIGNLRETCRMTLRKTIRAKTFDLLEDRFGEAALDILGMRATLSEQMPDAIDNGRFEQNLRHSLMWVISIGTNEIQRSLIAQRGLGLPR